MKFCSGIFFAASDDRLVEDAMSGRHLAANHTPVCDPPPVMAVPDVMISEKVLKVSSQTTLLYTTFVCLNEQFNYRLNHTDRIISFFVMIQIMLVNG